MTFKEAKDVCNLNQDIINKFKSLDDEKYQEEYIEHCRKMSIIDAYEDEIKEVLFLSSGCVLISTYSYEEYGLGLSPDYISLERLVDKIQALKAKKLGLQYSNLNHSFYGNFIYESDCNKYGLKFIREMENKEYLEYFLSSVNQYSKEFYNKEYFLRHEGGFCEYYGILVTTDETWKMEYSRHGDTITSWGGLALATMVPVLGWLFIFSSVYHAIRLYTKHKRWSGYGN